MDKSRVKLNSGELEGAKIKSVGGREYFSFKGIPYAEPPIGKLRFKEPVPVKAWSVIKNATKEGNISLQIDEKTKKVIGDEDCLFLNVNTPFLPSKNQELCPVVVYFHHGGFIVGSGNSELFGPDFFVENDIVFVSINYRLGAFGFLCLNSKDAAGNMGLKDQTLALKWVKENVSLFNGNPDDVTLIGISAGSASIEYQMVSPAAQGLFHKAILQSGSCLNPWARTREPIKLAFESCQALGENFDNVTDVFEFLLKIDAHKLVEASNRSIDDDDRKSSELFKFTPVIEKVIVGVEPFLCEDPLVLFKEGKFAKIPILSGFSEKEGILFKEDYGTAADEMLKQNFVDYLPSNFKGDNKELDSKLKQLYRPKYDDLNEDDMVNDYLSDLLFLGGIYYSLKCRLSFDVKNYVYRFKYDSRANYIKVLYDIKEAGACHGDEVSFLAPNVVVKESHFTANDKLVRSRMVQMWTSFVKTGNPTSTVSDDVDVEWSSAMQNSIGYLEIDNRLIMKYNPWPERLSFWVNLYDKLSK